MEVIWKQIQNFYRVKYDNFSQLLSALVKVYKYTVNHKNVTLCFWL